MDSESSDTTGGGSLTEEDGLEAIRYSAHTDIGRRRQENQDSYGILQSDHFKFYIVADGMGGVKGGAVASRLAVEVVNQCLQDRKDVIGVSDISSAVSHANSAIFDRGLDDTRLAGMGTTLVGLCFVNCDMYIVNVGDSRAYRIRSGEVKQLTEDHTLVNELLRTGAITPDQIENHPVSHMLTRSLGPTPVIEIDCCLCEEGPARDDVYVLCSDGLYNLVSDEEIALMIDELPLEQAGKKLIDLANQRGGTDNITLILISIEDGFPLSVEDRDALQEEKEKEDEEQEGEQVEPEEKKVPGKDIPVESLAAADAEMGTVEESDEDPKEEREEGEEVEQPVSKVKPTVEGDGAVADFLKETTEQEIFVDRRPEMNKALDPSATSVESKVAPSVETPGSRRRVMPAALSTLFLVVLVAAASYTVGVLYSNPSEVETTQTASTATVEVAPPEVQTEPEVVEKEPAPVVAVKEVVREPEIRFEPEVVIESNDVDSLIDDFQLEEDQLRRIRNRNEDLVRQLAELDEQIKAFSGSISGTWGDTLATGEVELASIGAELDQIGADNKVATRRLSIWYERRTRLSRGDPLKVATEVAASSEVVRTIKKAFEEVTYSYLRESDVLRYNPEDQVQKQRVKELLSQRKLQLEELKRQVKKVIGREINDSQRRIAELAIARDGLNSDKIALENQIELINIMLNGSSEEKEAKKEELVIQRDRLREELRELRELLGE